MVHAYLEEGTSKVDFNGCPPVVGTALRNEYPEVKTTCRYLPAFILYMVVSGENKFMERTALADFSFFDIFSFPFVYGGKGDDNTPNRIVLTEKASQKYFGKTNPVGKMVRIDNRVDMTVVGIIKNLLETFGAKMVEGNFLSMDQEGIVINKTFADIIGWDSFTGKTVTGYWANIYFFFWKHKV